MSALVQKLERKLAQAGLSEKGLREQKTAAFVARSEDGKALELHVAPISGAPDVDQLEVRLTEGVKAGPMTGTGAKEERDLEGLGKWDVYRIDAKTLAQGAQKGLRGVEVQIAAPGSELSYTFSLAFLLADVMGAGDIGLRAEAPWPEHFPNTEPLRELLMATTPPGQPVRVGDEQVSVETYLAAKKRLAELDRLRSLSGFDSIRELLGIELEVPLPPLRQVRARRPALEEGRLVSPEAEAYLKGAGVELPEDGVLTVAFAELANDAMLDVPAPPAVAEELVALYVAAKETAAQAAAMFCFDEDAPAAAPAAKKVNRGPSELEAAKAARKQRILESLSGLGVSDETCAQLGEQLALATEPRHSALLLIAGPRGSAADVLEQVALREVGPSPLLITEELIADPGCPALFAQGLVNRDGVSSAIAHEKLEAHRRAEPRGGMAKEWSAAAHVPIHVQGLQSVAQKASAASRKAHIQQFLKTFARATGLGLPITVAGPGGSKTETTKLPQCVVVARWPAAPDVPVRLGVDAGGNEVEVSLKELLQDPDLAPLVSLGRVVSFQPATLADHVGYLEWKAREQLPFEVEVTGADGRKRLGKPLVMLSEEVTASLAAAIGEVGAGWPIVLERALAELRGLTNDLVELPRAPKVRVDFSDQLTPKGRQRALGDRRPPVSQLFSLLPEAEA